MNSLGITCGQCNKAMTRENSTAAPEFFLCDDCAAAHGIRPPDRPAAQEQFQLQRAEIDRLKEWTDAYELANAKLSDDLAATRQKLAEAQADAAAKADALAYALRWGNDDDGDWDEIASRIQSALASTAGDALVKEHETQKAALLLALERAKLGNECVAKERDAANAELERLRAEKEQETQRADYNNSLAAEKAVALSVSEEKRKEIAKDFETAFRAVRIENDALRAQRDQAVLLARVYKEAVYQTDMAHIKSAEHPDSDDLAAAWGDAAVAKRTAEVALAAFLQSLNPPTSDDTLKV